MASTENDYLQCRKSLKIQFQIIRDREFMYKRIIGYKHVREIQYVPLSTEPGISLIILPLIRILKRNLKRTTDTFLITSYTTDVFLFKFRCNIFISV